MYDVYMCVCLCVFVGGYMGAHTCLWTWGWRLMSVISFDHFPPHSFWGRVSESNPELADTASLPEAGSLDQTQSSSIQPVFLASLFWGSLSSAFWSSPVLWAVSPALQTVLSKEEHPGVSVFLLLCEPVCSLQSRHTAGFSPIPYSLGEITSLHLRDGGLPPSLSISCHCLETS